MEIVLRLSIHFKVCTISTEDNQLNFLNLTELLDSRSVHFI